MSETTCPCGACELHEHGSHEFVPVCFDCLRAEGDKLVVSIKLSEQLQRQLDAVDMALPQWRGTGTGRVSTIKALRDQITALEAALRNNEPMCGYCANRGYEHYLMQCLCACHRRAQ